MFTKTDEGNSQINFRSLRVFSTRSELTIFFVGNNGEGSQKATDRFGVTFVLWASKSEITKAGRGFLRRAGSTDQTTFNFCGPPQAAIITRLGLTWMVTPAQEMQ
jgi:hypothetical protein